MTMFLTLDLPEAAPRWASSGTNAKKPPLGPQISGLTPTLNKMPIEWQNWILKINYEWARRVVSPILMNWRGETNLGSTGVIYAVAFHPGVGRWVVADNGGNTRTSVDGEAWAAGTGLGGSVPIASNGAIDTTRYIFPKSADLVYNTTGTGAWTTIASATMGGSGAVNAIGTKYPDSDFTLVCRGIGASLSVRRATTGITGVWTGSTVQPPTVPASSFARSLLHIGGAVWLLLVGNTTAPEAVLYRSLDDGGSWSIVTGMSFPAASTGPNHIAYNQDDSRLVIVGSVSLSGSIEHIAYSDDLGDTWTTATINKNGVGSSTALYRVYYCGGSTWIAVATALSISLNITVYVSTDNGENWRVSDIHSAVASTAEVIGCDGRKLIGFGDTANYIRTDAI